MVRFDWLSRLQLTIFLLSALERGPRLTYDDTLWRNWRPGKVDAEDEAEEDDVFANENAQAMKGENTTNENYHAPIVSTSSINGVKSPVLVVVSSSNHLPNSQIVAEKNDTF